MRTGGNTGAMQRMQQSQVPPTPLVDPENEEFVIFVRSTKQPQWVPLSVVKGGAAANMLVKGLETEFMRETTVKTLVEVRCWVPACWALGGCAGWLLGLRRSPGGGLAGKRRALLLRLPPPPPPAPPLPPTAPLWALPAPTHRRAEHWQGCVQGQGADHRGAAQGLPALQGDQGV